MKRFFCKRDHGAYKWTDGLICWSSHNGLWVGGHRVQVNIYKWRIYIHWFCFSQSWGLKGGEK